jgi:hypothetical protein
MFVSIYSISGMSQWFFYKTNHGSDSNGFSLTESFMSASVTLYFFISIPFALL